MASINTINVGGIDNPIEDSTARSRITSEAARLDNRIDQAIVPSGGAPSAAEVTDARIAVNGAVYNSLGDAIRTQFQRTQFNYGDPNNINSCDDVDTNSVYFVSTSGGVATPSDFPFNTPGWLMTFKHNTNSNLRLQIAYPYDPSVNPTKYRSRQAGGWTSWVNLGGGLENYLESCDLNDLRSGNHFYLLISTNTYQHMPVTANAGWLYILQSGSFVYQIFYEWNGPRMWARYLEPNRIGDWVQMSGGGGDTYNITQEISRDTFNNTYNITTSPTITTDTNGWLQAVDTNTSSEIGKTDMTGAIMSMLNSTGYCHLGPGIFYVTGGIDMPSGSTIEGCGKDTIIRLLGSVTSGYILRLKEYSHVKNICFSGGYSDLDVESSNIGGRKGIIYIGNRDGQDPSVTPSTTKSCQINGCFFENLDSGIYGYNSGGGTQEGLIVDNCYIQHCKAGINLDYWTEYSTFTNVVTFQCHFACINNGGNNKFVNCVFHGIVGFLMDNSGNDKPNDSHGSCVCCTFNHIHNFGPTKPDTAGKGTGLHVINNNCGFVFSGCQFWYSNINIQNSKGIVITDSIMGGNTITVAGTYGAFFNGLTFYSTPSISKNSATKFINCYDFSGNAIGG